MNMKKCKTCKTMYKYQSIDMVFLNNRCTVCKFCKVINLNKKGV